MTVYLSALGSLTGNGVLTLESGVASVVQSNPQASAGTNYYLKDIGGGVFVSTALPTAVAFPTIQATASITAVANTRYTCLGAAAIIVTLPASPALGDTVAVSGSGGATFNFTVDANPTQTISAVSSVKSTAGANITSTQPGCGAVLYADSAGTSANWVLQITGGTFSFT